MSLLVLPLELPLFALTPETPELALTLEIRAGPLDEEADDAGTVTTVVSAPESESEPEFALLLLAEGAGAAEKVALRLLLDEEELD